MKSEIISGQYLGIIYGIIFIIYIEYMKVLFNLKVCQPVGNVKRHGGGKYGEIVFERIVERGLPVYCYYDSHNWLNPKIKNLFSRLNVTSFDLSQFSIEQIVNENSIDILYTPILLDLDNFSACKLVCTIHGLRDVETPSDMYFFKYKTTFRSKAHFLLDTLCKKRNVKKNELHMQAKLQSGKFSFVTVSNHSKFGFKSYYPKLYKNYDIPVFYSPSTIDDNIILDRVYKEKYFLLVSAGIWSKNNLRAIKALDILFSEGMLNDYKVRITGVDSASVYRYRLKNPGRFTFMGYVDDKTMSQLYHDAYCLVYPSLNEGFGYPPIESMSFGVPVIASSFSSVSEVCGDAALYVNPFSVEEIMNRILQMVDSAVYKEYKEKACVNYIKIYNRQKKDLDRLIDYIYGLK